MIGVAVVVASRAHGRQYRVLDPLVRRRDRAQMAEAQEGRSRDRRARRREKRATMARPAAAEEAAA